jgi:hypothetical protein
MKLGTKYCVLFLDIEFKLDTAWDGGGYSELRRYQHSVNWYSFWNNSHRPAIYHITLLAAPVAMPEDNVPRLQARVGSERLPNL